ncbi:hypothetical protein Mapa_009563 [Marchantia paleacea]|nr:hypothetical protein Mapa_009563 [Marchantia paleacea]
MAVAFARALPLFLLYLGLCSARTFSGTNKSNTKVVKYVEMAPVRHGSGELLSKEQEEFKQDSNAGCGEHHLQSQTEEGPFRYESSIRREDRPVFLTPMEADKSEYSQSDFLGHLGYNKVPNLGLNMYRATKLEVSQRLPRNTPHPFSGPNKRTSDGPSPL